MDERIRCSFCLQELNDMKDPRQLTCAHIFCMSCIRSDCKQENAVKCPICRWVTKVENLNTLTKPSARKLSRKPEGQVTEHKCNRCEDNTAAVSYCLECADLICDDHLESHKEHFKKAHTIIDVQTFARHPAAYNKPTCSKHTTAKISQVCSRCYLLACSECNPPRNCPDKPDRRVHSQDHTFHTLSRVSDDFKKEFDILMKGCTDKVTEICKLEKEAWLKLDTLIEKCQKMVADVQKKTEKQVAEIRKSSQQLIQQIHDYRVDRTNRVQVFVSDLLMKREELEQLQKSVRHLVQNCSVVEKIQQKEEKTSALKVGKEMEIKPCDWEELALVAFATQKPSELTLSYLPSSLTHLKQYRTPVGNHCRSVCFTTDGELLVACDRCISQYYHGTMEKKVLAKDMRGTLRSLATQRPGEVIFLLSNGNIEKSTEPYDSSITISKAPDTTRIAISQANFHVWSHRGHHIVRHDLINDTKSSWKFSELEITSICCHPDQSLLLVSKQSGLVSKWRENKEKEVFQRVWSCNELPGAYAVCTDKSGWIYVAACGGRIYIVGEGKILRSFENDQLTECEDPEYGDIAVYGDRLVAIESKSDRFNTFSLK